jgi:hypothetical protein
MEDCVSSMMKKRKGMEKDNCVAICKSVLMKKSKDKSAELELSIILQKIDADPTYLKKLIAELE